MINVDDWPRSGVSTSPRHGDQDRRPPTRRRPQHRERGDAQHPIPLAISAPVQVRGSMRWRISPSRGRKIQEYKAIGTRAPDGGPTSSKGEKSTLKFQTLDRHGNPNSALEAELFGTCYSVIAVKQTIQGSRGGT